MNEGEEMKRSVGGAKVLLVCVLIVWSSGCDKEKRGLVARQWSLAFRELQVVPVFPPREDVRVGDIYVTGVAPKEEDKLIKERGFLPIGVWAGRTRFKDMLTLSYEQSYVLPVTPSDTQPGPAGSDYPPIVPQPRRGSENEWSGHVPAYIPNELSCLHGNSIL